MGVQAALVNNRPGVVKDKKKEACTQGTQSHGLTRQSDRSTTAKGQARKDIKNRKGSSINIKRDHTKKQNQALRTVDTAPHFLLPFFPRIVRSICLLYRHSRLFPLLLSIHIQLYHPDSTSPTPDSRVPGGSKAGYRADGHWCCCPSSHSPRRRRCKSRSRICSAEARSATSAMPRRRGTTVPG